MTEAATSTPTARSTYAPRGYTCSQTVLRGRSSRSFSVPDAKKAIGQVRPHRHQPPRLAVSAIAERLRVTRFIDAEGSGTPRSGRRGRARISTRPHQQGTGRPWRSVRQPSSSGPTPRARRWQPSRAAARSPYTAMLAAGKPAAAEALDETSHRTAPRVFTRWVICRPDRIERI